MRKWHVDVLDMGRCADQPRPIQPGRCSSRGARSARVFVGLSGLTTGMVFNTEDGDIDGACTEKDSGSNSIIDCGGDSSSCSEGGVGEGGASWAN